MLIDCIVLNPHQMAVNTEIQNLPECGEQETGGKGCLALNGTPASYPPTWGLEVMEEKRVRRLWARQQRTSAKQFSGQDGAVAHKKWLTVGILAWIGGGRTPTKSLKLLAVDGCWGKGSTCPSDVVPERPPMFLCEALYPRACWLH